MGMAPVPCGLELDMVAVLPGPGGLEVWPVFERNEYSAAIPDTRFEECNGQGPTDRDASQSDHVVGCRRTTGRSRWRAHDTICE